MIWIWFILVFVAAVSLTKHVNTSKALDYLHKDYKSLQDRFHAKNSELASVRVKHGQSWEKWVPYTKKFEELVGDRTGAIFLGMPIDYIHFSDDKITFVEIKTGNARLSSKQKQIKKLIQQHAVYWVEMNDSLESKDNEKTS